MIARIALPSLTLVVALLVGSMLPAKVSAEPPRKPMVADLYVDMGRASPAMR